MVPDAHDSSHTSHRHDHPHAPGEHAHAPAAGHRPKALAPFRRPGPALSLLMHGVMLRLSGAAGLAALIWLAVAWALKDAA